MVIARAESLTQRVVGDRTPVGGTFTSFTQPAVNNVGDVPFGASLAGGGVAQGIFLASGSRITTSINDMGEALCRYIVLNPMRARLVAHPQEWR